MRLAATLLLGAALGLSLAPAAASAADAKASAYKTPRNIFGQPDLGEFWSNASLSTEQRPAGLGGRLVYTPEEVKKLEQAATDEFTEGNKPTDPNEGAPKQGGEYVKNVRPGFAAAGGTVGGYNLGWLDPGHQIMRVRGEPRTSFLLTPDGRVPPRKAGAPVLRRSAQADNDGEGSAEAGDADNPENRSLGDRCIIGFGRNGGPPMLPNGFYNNNYQFIQNRNHVAIVIEMVHDVRRIDLNRTTHLPPHIRPWFGDSIGRWEGDTLVVETTNIPQAQAYAGSWQNLKVTERFTRAGRDRLHYQYTIEDPTSWDKPFGGEYEFSKLNGQVHEYACHEGNYALEGILAGARQQEQEAAKAAGPRTAR